MQHPTLTVQTVSMAARANLFCDLTPSLYTTNNIASKKNHLWCFFLCTYGATPQPWWWWLVKIWKSDPLQQAIKNLKTAASILSNIDHPNGAQSMIAVFELKKSKRNHAKIHQEFKKEQSKTSIAAAKKNSIYKWAASFYLMNISMPNNDRTGGTLFLNYPSEEMPYWYYLQPKTKK